MEELFGGDDPNDATSKEEEDPGYIPEKKKKKRVLPPFHFTESQEAQLAEWWKEHECFCNKKWSSFKDTKTKRRLLEERAQEIECTIIFYDFIPQSKSTPNRNNTSNHIDETA